MPFEKDFGNGIKNANSLSLSLPREEREPGLEEA